MFKIMHSDSISNPLDSASLINSKGGASSVLHHNSNILIVTNSGDLNRNSYQNYLRRTIDWRFTSKQCCTI